MGAPLFPLLLSLAAAFTLPAAAQTSRPVPEPGTAPAPRQLPALPTPGQPPAASDEVKDGLYDGQGKLTYADKARYEGEWSNDRANGWGTRSGGRGGQVFTGIRTNGCFRENQRWATVGATALASGFQ